MLVSCGKKKNPSEVRYEVVDGKIVEVSGAPTPALPDNFDSFSAAPESAESDFFAPGELAPSVVTDGTAVSFPDEAYNSISSADSVKIESLKKQFESAAAACRDVYAAADKGNTLNVTLSEYAVQQMVQALGSAGFSAVDSNGNCTMSNPQPFIDFGEDIVFGQNLSATYYVVYTDGHMSLFHLYREAKQWHLISMSMAWNDDLSIRIYSEGRYAIGKVEYTNKGWLIYNRNTSDFDENQKANTDPYTMVRVQPYDEICRELCRKYIEPVGYLENNLYISNWNEADFSAIDFNSVYSYIFQISNGTSEMLSSYNVRNYYKSFQKSRLYLVPSNYFEENTLKRFNIDIYTLRSIADYDPSEDAYYYLGYNKDYFNVTPRTPFPEVVSYVQNTDTTITMTVDAVNPWYGTDRAFEHVVTVRPQGDGGYKYVSNYLVESENNILPDQKLSEMREVEKSLLSE